MSNRQYPKLRLVPVSGWQEFAINQRLMRRLAIKLTQFSVLQTSEPQTLQPHTEKDRKTSLNLGTKYQHNNNNNNSSSNRSSTRDVAAKTATNYNNLNSVKYLTNKFDYRNNNSHRSEHVTPSETELKQLVQEQTELITNLRDKLEAKDKRIKELESKVKLLMKNAPPAKLDLSLELNGHSLA